MNALQRAKDTNSSKISKISTLEFIFCAQRVEIWLIGCQKMAFKRYLVNWIVCVLCSYVTLMVVCLTYRYHHTGPINSVYALREGLARLAEEVGPYMSSLPI